MENIVSNWTNSYDVNNDDDLDNDVVTEGCYEGSTNIKYIDGELYMNEYGELTAMEYIPQEWGGNASYEDNQTVFDVKITADNLVYSMLGNVGDYKTNWGDGTEDMNISHEYSKPGTYTIITENTQTFAQGTMVDTSISSPIVRFRALNKSLTNGAHLFDGWSNLLKVNKLNNNFTSIGYMFRNCSKLTSVDLSDCTFTLKATNISYMFYNCAKLTSLNFTIPDKVTNISYMFYQCTSLESISLNIPDTCQDISYLFYKCSKLTDISGTIFGSNIVLYNNWYLSAPITKANNLTIKTNNVKFDSFNNLRELNNILITGNVTSLSKFASYTPQLSSFSFNPDSDLSNVTSISEMFYQSGGGANEINEISFKDMNLSSLKFISKPFYGSCDSLKKIDFSDCIFGNNTMSITQPFLGKKDIVLDFSRAKMWKMTAYSDFLYSAKNFSILFTGADFEYTDSFNSVFKFNNGIELTNVDFTDAIIPDHITDFTSMFEGAGITEDIVFPSTATNVERAFYGCTSMTHVHSNWDKTYTNGITHTDCYAGCTSITHIDDNNTIAYEGDLGLDYVPIDWGGNGFTTDCTTIYEIEITSDYTSKALRPIGTKSLLSLDSSVAKVNWGDGSSAELLVQDGALITHTYTKEGIYYVKAHNVLGRGYGPGFNLVMTKLLQISKYQNGSINSDLSFACASCGAKLTYADFSNLDVSKSFRTQCMFKEDKNLETVVLPKNMIINYSSEMFSGCSKLTEIRNYETWDMTKCGHASAMFSGCSSLGNLDVSNWGMGGISATVGWGVSYMFTGCKKLKVLDVSKWKTSTWNGCTSIFQGCESLETIDLSGWSSFSQGLTPSKDINSMFRDCKKLKTVIGLENILDTNVTGINHLFCNCNNLTDFSFLDNCDFSSIKNMQSTFYGHKGITSLDLSNWKNVNSVTNMSYFCSDTNISSLDISSFNLYNINNMNYIFDKVRNLTDLRFGYNLNCEFGYSNIKYCTNLTQESVVSVLNGLYDRSGDTSLNAEIGSTLMAKLTSDQIAIATNKNWTVI